MSKADLRSIKSHADLVSERMRLEKLIDNQKNIVRHDLDELKAEFKKEIRPAIETANFVKKFTKPETRKDAWLGLGVNLAIDLVSKRVLRNTNVLMQFFIPRMLKNYTSHFIHNLNNHSASSTATKTYREVI